ncbi:MAG: S-layer homology domain-containing protein [Clostridia bacterium]|nr:S-layer homology domain-containing protein [Clostridia bacterium]
MSASVGTHTLVLKENGDLLAYGENDFGQLGIGNNIDSPVLQLVMSGVKSIAAGYWHSMAVKENGDLWVWGYNHKGELGNGIRTYSATPNVVLSEETPEITGSNPSGLAEDFTDIKGHWAEKYICEIASRGILNGTAPEIFAPQKHITRAQCAAVLTGYLNIGDNVINTESFKDVKRGAWYYKYVESAKSKAVMQGKSDGTFDPDEPIKREDAALLFSRMLSVKLMGTVNLKEKFFDTEKISPYAQEGIQICVEFGLISGRTINGRNYIRPRDSITRAEFVAMLHRFIDEMNE